jgi:hypothetical protein
LPAAVVGSVSNMGSTCVAVPPEVAAALDTFDAAVATIGELNLDNASNHRAEPINGTLSRWGGRTSSSQGGWAWGQGPSGRSSHRGLNGRGLINLKHVFLHGSSPHCIGFS